MIDIRDNFQLPGLNDAIDEELYQLNKKWTAEDYDATLSMAKSIVESVCKFICYQKDPRADLTGNLNDLLKNMMNSLNLNIDKNNYFFGLKNIVAEIGEARNHNVLSHGHRSQSKSI